MNENDDDSRSEADIDSDADLGSDEEFEEDDEEGDVDDDDLDDDDDDDVEAPASNKKRPASHHEVRANKKRAMEEKRKILANSRGKKKPVKIEYEQEKETNAKKAKNGIKTPRNGNHSNGNRNNKLNF